MKKLLIFGVIATLLVAGCIDDTANTSGEPATAEASNTDPAAVTSIHWIDSIRNMGTIKEGQKLEVSFRFTNTGDKPLVIQSAQPSCGCTVPSKPEKPIMPGQEGLITAVFDSQGRKGSNHKTITVMANTSGTQSHVLEFNVDVVGTQDGPKATTSQTTSF